jgi:hypothetical protein
VLFLPPISFLSVSRSCQIHLPIPRANPCRDRLLQHDVTHAELNLHAAALSAGVAPKARHTRSTPLLIYAYLHPRRPQNDQLSQEAALFSESALTMAPMAEAVYATVRSHISAREALQPLTT